MTKQDFLNKMREEGLWDCLLYYLGRFCSKTETVLIGRAARRFCRVKENRIVFKNRCMQDFSDNPRAFFEYLVTNGYNEEYEIIWLVSRKQDFRDKKYKNVKFVTAENKYGWSSCRAYYYSATAKYFFFTNNTADLNKYHCKGQTVINLWHGCGYKGSTRENKDIPLSLTMMAFDYAIVPGKLFVEAKAKYWGCSMEKILPLGYPRYDWMCAPHIDREQIWKTLFGSGKVSPKVIIWMPTFRKSELKGYGENEIELPFELPALESFQELQELDKHCRELGVHLIIKKHPLQTGWTQEEESLVNIRYLSDELLKSKKIQLYTVIGMCDAMISDYSSAAVDFVLLNRPIGFVLSDYEIYEKKRGFIFKNPLQYMPGERLYHLKDLKNFVTNVKNEKDLYEEQRREVLPLMHAPADCYCARIAEHFGIKKQASERKD